MSFESKGIKPLEDNDYMPSGKYSEKGSEGKTKMIDVPATYLRYVYDNNLCNVRVRDYIRENLEVIDAQIKKEQK